MVEQGPSQISESHNEIGFGEALSIKELIRRTQEAIPYLVQASTIGAIAQTGQIIEVNLDNQPYIANSRGNLAPITPSLELYPSTPAFIVELEDDGTIRPDPYAVDLIHAINNVAFNNNNVVRIATADRSRPYRHGLRVSHFSDLIDTEATVFYNNRWRVEMTKTSGQYRKSVSFTSPLRPEQGDSFLTFKYDFLRRDKVGALAGKLRQSLLILKGSEQAEAEGVTSLEREIVVKNILRFREAIQAPPYSPQDFKRDSRLLMTSGTADEFLKAFLLGIIDSGHPLPRSLTDLMTTAIENTHQKPTKEATVVVTLRLIRETGRFAFSDAYSAGVEETQVNIVISQSLRAALRSKDNLALLTHIWSEIIESNIGNFEALIHANIKFTNEEKPVTTLATPEG